MGHGPVYLEGVSYSWKLELPLIFQGCIGLSSQTITTSGRCLEFITTIIDESVTSYNLLYTV